MSDVGHQCPYCELRFSYLAELKDHVWSDHPDHRHVVEDLDRHELPHSGQLGATTMGGYLCPRCELRFAFTAELHQHVTVDHH
jgi:hypothetical protein